MYWFGTLTSRSNLHIEQQDWNPQPSNYQPDLHPDWLVMATYTLTTRIGTSNLQSTKPDYALGQTLTNRTGTTNLQSTKPDYAKGHPSFRHTWIPTRDIQWSNTPNENKLWFSTHYSAGLQYGFQHRTTRQRIGNGNNYALQFCSAHLYGYYY